MAKRLRFGTFMAPFHPPAQNPTLALQRDLDLIQHMDRLGYDEAWIGEHHSAGTELIASPEIFIATAAERTRSIKLERVMNFRHLAHLIKRASDADFGPISASGPRLLRLAAVRMVHNTL